MIFLFPYSTDAPLYHLPLTTVAMILVNVGAFIASCMAPEESAMFVLSYGEGLQPLQWVTSNFMHDGIVHLLVNMVFLWTFGVIVEGKIGWWKFLLIFLGVGVGQCFIEQTMMLWADGGGSLGASSIVFALMTIALIWAPKNDVQCAFWFVRAVFYFEAPVMMFVFGFVSLNLLNALWSISSDEGFHMISEILHLMGVAAGAIVGVWMVKTNRVDCEGWDVFSVSLGRDPSGGRSDESDEEIAERRDAHRQQRETAMAEFQAVVESGQAQLALAAHRRMNQRFADWRPREEDMLKLITTFHQQQKWSESIPAMVEYLRLYHEREPLVRLKLAHILLESASRPAQALKVLEKLAPDRVPAEKRELYDALLEKARRLREDAEFEVTEEW